MRLFLRKSAFSYKKYSKKEDLGKLLSVYENQKDKMMASFKLGLESLQKFEYINGFEYLTIASDISKEIKDQEMYNNIAISLLEISVHLQEFQKVLDLATVITFDKIKDSERYTQVLILKAKAHLYLQQYTEAEDVLSSVLHTGSEVQKVRIYDHYGAIKTAQGELEEAKRCFQECNRISKKLGLRFFEAKSLASIGNIERETDVEKGRKKLKQALAISQEIQHKVLEDHIVDLLSKDPNSQDSIEQRKPLGNSHSLWKSTLEIPDDFVKGDSSSILILKKQIQGLPLKLAIPKIHKFAKENPKLDELGLKKLENSTQEDYILSIRIAIAYKDKERILKAFDHETLSAKWVACGGTHLFDDQTLESLVFKLPKAFRAYFIRNIKRKRRHLIVNIFERIFDIDVEEGHSLLPFLPDDLCLKMIEKHSIKLQELGSRFVTQKKEITYQMFLKEKEISWLHSKVITGLIQYKEDEMFEILKSKNSLRYHYRELKKKSNFISYLSLVDLSSISTIPKKFSRKFTVEDIKTIWEIFGKKKDLFMTLFPSKLIERLNVDFFETFKDSTNLSILSKIPSREVSYKLAAKFLENVEKTQKLTSREKIPYLIKQDISKVRQSLLDFCSDSNPTNRIEGYKALIDCTFFSDKEHAETMEFLIKKMKTEQDPVKVEILPSIYSPFFQDPKSITDLLLPCISAVDHGYSTMRAVCKVISLVFRNYQKSEDHINASLSIYKELLNKEYVSFSLTMFYPQSGEEIELLMKYFKTEIESQFHFLSLTRKEFKHPVIDQLVENLISTCESKMKILGTSVTDQINFETYNTLKRITPYYLSEKKTRFERVQRLLNISKSLIYENMVVETLIQNIGFLEILETYKFLIPFKSFFKLLQRHKMSFNHDEREKLIKILMSHINNSYFDSYFVRMIGHLHLGKINNEIEEFIEKVKSSKDLKISQSALSFNSNLDIIEGKRFFQSIKKDTSGVILGGALKRCISLSKDFEKEVLTYITTEEFLKNGITIQKEILKAFYKNKTEEFLKILHNLWKMDLHKDVRVTVASLMSKYLLIDESIENIFREIALNHYLPLVEVLFIKESLNRKQISLLSKIQYLTLKNESFDVFKHAIDKMIVTKENANPLFSQVSQILLTFPNDRSFTRNLCYLLLRCLTTTPILRSDFLDFIKIVLSHDKRDNIHSPQRDILNIITETSIPKDLIDDFTSLMLSIDDCYLKNGLRIMSRSYSLEVYIEKCLSLKLKSLPKYFVIQLAVKYYYQGSITLKVDQIEALTKSDNVDVLQFLIQLLSQNSRYFKGFLNSDKGKEFIEKLINHQDGVLRFLALNFQINE